MNGENRYILQRGLFISLGALLIVIALFRSCVPPTASTSLPQQPPGYKLARCDPKNTRTFDYSNDNPLQISIPLREGGYCDHYILPIVWNFYFIQKTQDRGDYATVWCSGKTLPEPIRSDAYAYLNNSNTASQPGDLFGCHLPGQSTDDFFVQGRGKLLLTRTSTKTVPTR